ncbi:alpha/beta hydrolase [Rheinheimera riviphila]|uniref:Alpha/beta hydrolase n=1 Tax=Rheinheimera riviphila TaxID=1834037 RepID=A0A437R0L0_9GAMM|nr:alpha/beta hydrolase [Rheinheimera riviphila]RVU40270.1 alpha/beta hydrolase [Rheinheimera riviphila]
MLLIFLLFKPVQAATPVAESLATAPSKLPQYSELISSGTHKFHLRKMAPTATTTATFENLPVVVLLSGPNQNFHADSAWFALLQPLLAQKYQVLAIDRLGNGFSDNADDVSYRRFSQDLATLLPNLTKQPVILISFASASISARLLHQQQTIQGQTNSQVQAMLWIDPDIPTPDALALYQGYPVDWYQKNLQQLLPELAKGVWNQRTKDKLHKERAEIVALLSSDNTTMMDWGYFDAISGQRQSPQRQQQRAIEIANYAKDLDLYAALPAITDIPVTVIDSDFETAAIQADPAQAKQLQQWQQQGSAWSQHLAKNSGGQYLPLQHSDHLVMFQHPETIVAAVDWLSEKVTVFPLKTKH